MRVKTWGKESKDREGKENGEKAGESRQTPLSWRETSLMRCKQFICVGEKTESEPGRSEWDLREVWDAHHKAPEPHCTTKGNAQTLTITGPGSNKPPLQCSSQRRRVQHMSCTFSPSHTMWDNSQRLQTLQHTRGYLNTQGTFLLHRRSLV